jgi:hypothetical protein
MSKMWFDKTELTKTIQKNRDGHRAEFEEAMKGYEEEATKSLGRILQAIKDGKRPVISLYMTIPEDHTKDYDRVLKMLAMSQEGNIELDEDDFAQYVQDDWGWKKTFETTNALYKKSK